MRILPLLLLSLIAATASAAGDPAKPISVTAREITPSRPALGVIRWDMFLGHAFRTQSQEMDFLRPEKYHWRAPFFFRRTGDPAHPLSFNPENRPEIARQAMEQEIEFAASAGIDYWAFGHNGNHLNFRDSLHDGLDAYLTASNRDKMPFCIIVNCGEMASFNVYDPPPVTYTEERTQKSWNSFTAELVALAKLPPYVRVAGGRPLIYLYTPEKLGSNIRAGVEKDLAPAERIERLVGQLREAMRAAGLGNPLIVAMVDDRMPGWRELHRKGVYDIVTYYHYRHPGKDTPYGTLWSIIEQQVLNGKFGQPDTKVFPITMSGANGMPRFKPEGGGFPEWDYREPAPGEQAAHVRGAFDYITRNPAKCDPQHVIMYAWNEFSEGGFLCPTMGEAPFYKPVTRQIDEVSAELKNWTPPEQRKRLGEVVANFPFGGLQPNARSVATAGAPSEFRLDPFAYYIAENAPATGRLGHSLRRHAAEGGKAVTLGSFPVSPKQGAASLRPTRLEFSLRVSQGNIPLSRIPDPGKPSNPHLPLPGDTGPVSVPVTFTFAGVSVEAVCTLPRDTWKTFAIDLEPSAALTNGATVSVAAAIPPLLAVDVDDLRVIAQEQAP